VNKVGIEKDQRSWSTPVLSVSELERYVRRINRTNLSATLADGETTLTDTLARRDALALRYGNLKILVNSASDRVPRYGRRSVSYLPSRLDP
jgi:hypothetical protein